MLVFYKQIPIVHVEAGLRTYDIYSSYPEEFNREAVSIISKYNFAPTEAAKANLLKEGKKSSSIYVTGNTVIDALKTTVREDYHHLELVWAADSRLILITAHRREKILLDGKEIDFTNPTWKNMVGYVPQSVFIFEDSIINNIILGEHITEDVENRVIEILKTVQLGDFIKDLPQGIYTEVGERGARISGGQRQRFGLARALYNNPDILVLDEATSALDNSTEEAIMKTINDIKGSRTIIAIAHRLTTVEKCDHIYEVREGRVIAHTAEGVKIFKNKDGK